MTHEELGPLLGTIKYDDRPAWSTLALRLLRALHLPLWRQKQRLWALRGMEVREQGIVLLTAEGSNCIAYADVRKVWFEEFRSGDDAVGCQSARIDVIAQNLDVLFTLTLHNRPGEDADVNTMRALHARWKQATWKHYHVVAAVVEHEGRYLCMQKPQTRFAYTSLHWEFPGGKVEQGETEPEALKRELLEEMEYSIEPQRHLITIEHSYPDFSLSLSCWLCSAVGTDFVRKEHADHRWLLPHEMKELEWCAADAPVISLLQK